MWGWWRWGLVIGKWHDRDTAEGAGGAFALETDSALAGGAVVAVVDKFAIDPDPDGIVAGVDDHGVPLAEGFFETVFEFDNAAIGAPLLHIVNCDVLAYDPEVASIARLQLDLDRAGEGIVEGA